MGQDDTAPPPAPGAPDYKPEIAADAILHASEHPRREYFVGGSTVMTIVGNRLAPRIADHYLACTNVDAQQTDDPIPPNRPNYLYEPLSGDPGAHGRFNAEATDRSPTWWATKRRARIAPAVLAAAAGGAMAVAPRRR